MRLGVESELGIFGGWDPAKAHAVQTAIERLPHLASVREGVFLVNGGRYYVDQGLHNEFATPEVDSPSALVIAEFAARRVMQRAATHSGLTLFCANVSPGNRTTAGTHENYELPAPPEPAFFPWLNTHLATRILFSGAGGLDPFAAYPRPVLSPRACFMRADLCFQGTVRKSLVFVKPHHHGPGYRLHVFCGESLMSARANYLKYATTALVAFALSRGWQVGPGPFREPAVRVLHRVNRDIGMSSRHELADGRRLTALEIQRALHRDLAQRHDELPPWAGATLTRWAEALDDLERGDGRIAEYLDWAVFLRGFRQAEAVCAARHAKASDLLAMGQALYLRMHQLGDEGLFDTWTHDGLLQPGLPEVTESAIRAAESTPPPGRATRRAELIQRYKADTSIRLEWSQAENEWGETVEIPEGEAPANWMTPLETVPAWAATPPTESSGFDALFRRGAYHELVTRFTGHPLISDGAYARIYLRDFALSLARLGRDEEADAILASIRGRTDSYEDLSDRVFAAVNYGLAPPVDRLAPLIARGDERATMDAASGLTRFSFLQTKARMLCAAGQHRDAIALCRRLLAEEEETNRPRMFSRTRCCLAEALRLSGDTGEAAKLLDLAGGTYERHDLPGDFVDHALPLALKLLPTHEVRALLETTLDACPVEGYGLRRARILAVAARRLEHANLFRPWCTAVAAVPCLARCPVTQRIRNQWEAWVTPDAPDDASLDYWGVA